MIAAPTPITAANSDLAPSDFAYVALARPAMTNKASSVVVIVRLILKLLLKLKLVILLEWLLALFYLYLLTSIDKIRVLYMVQPHQSADCGLKSSSNGG